MSEPGSERADDDAAVVAGQERATALVNRLIYILNSAARDGHPADVLTALQHVTAITLNAYGVPVDVFVERVRKTSAKLLEDAMRAAARSNR